MHVPARPPLRLLLVTLLLPLSAGAKAPEPGASAPTFELPDVDGDPVKLESQRGSVVVLNFWASWCAPCLTEMPRLEALREQFEGQAVEVLLINIDKQKAPALGVMKRRPTQLKTLFDPQSSVVGLYDPPALPSTYLIGPEGTLSHVHVGEIDDAGVADLGGRIEALVPKAAAP